MTTPASEKHEFQAEVKQLLDIVVHSLYTDKEIFVRELVSNASDALEKLRHTQITEQAIFDDSLELEINITTDDTAGTITIQDFGIGMTRAELVENLGTIAHSGSKAFLQALKEGGAQSSNLIGQFGVGFYSAFMVAEKVTVYTHSWRNDAEHLVWASDGSGSYEIEESDGQRRGCKIVVKLKEDEKEFAKAETVKGILGRYSSFVQFPINLNGERVNTVQALWLRNKNEIKPEEYTEFYKFQANAFDEPRTYLHFSADAPLAINSLLFIPTENQERFGFGRMEAGVSLYCRKVLIDDKPEGLLPEWLRFLRGVVDSEDLPLNISRETMQDSALVRKINGLMTKRFLKHLTEWAKKQPEEYDTFFKTFGQFLKEGVTSDPQYHEQFGPLLRFESSLTEKGKTTSLKEIVSRASEEQKELYYLTGGSRVALESAPSLEAFKARSIEVIFLYEPVDEFVMNHLREFDGKALVAADQADISLDDVSADGTGEPLDDAAAEGLCAWMTTALGDGVKKITASKRLVDSPAVALNADKFMTPSMRRMMQAVNPEGGEGPQAEINLEVNTRHPLIKNLAVLHETDADLAALTAEQVRDNALIAGGYLEDARPMVDRVYQLLERLTAEK